MYSPDDGFQPGGLIAMCVQAAGSGRSRIGERLDRVEEVGAYLGRVTLGPHRTNFARWACIAALTFLPMACRRSSASAMV